MRASGRCGGRSGSRWWLLLPIVALNATMLYIGATGPGRSWGPHSVQGMDALHSFPSAVDAFAHAAAAAAAAGAGARSHVGSLGLAAGGGKELGALSAAIRGKTIVLQGLLADTLTDRMIGSIVSLCKNQHGLDVKLFVMMPFHFAIANGEALKSSHLDGCFHIIPEDEEEVAKLSRIDKLAYLRDAERSYLLENKVVTAAVGGADLVGVMDFDLDMDFGAFFRMVHTFISQGAYDVLCANGFEKSAKGEDIFYDTFPHIFLDKSWAYTTRVDLNGKRFGGAATNFTKADAYQRHLLESYKASDSAMDNRVFSCFGGASLYRTSVWMTQDCGYQASSPELEETLEPYRVPWKRHVEVCEHVRFITCLHERHANLTVAVEGTALLRRSEGDLSPNRRIRSAFR